MTRRSNDPIKAGVRQAKRDRNVGAGAACVDCCDDRAEMLVRRSRPKRCLKCYAVKKGKKPTESHHIAGEANSPIQVEIPITDHRKLSDAQYEWPPKTAQNPDGSPLLALSASLRGVADFIGELVTALIVYLAETAEKIDAWLCEKHGLWWKDGPFDGWQPG
jgi:hypothetical protein